MNLFFSLLKIVDKLKDWQNLIRLRLYFYSMLSNFHTFIFVSLMERKCCFSNCELTILNFIQSRVKWFWREWENENVKFLKEENANKYYYKTFQWKMQCIEEMWENLNAIYLFRLKFIHVRLAPDTTLFAVYIYCYQVDRYERRILWEMSKRNRQPIAVSWLKNKNF